MKYKKFREFIIEPYLVKFKNFKIKEILNYMPAGNDVIECLCEFEGTKEILFVKFERSKMADFESEVSNLNIIKKLNLYSKIPNVIESGVINNKRYIVLSKINGKRLSEILDDDKEKKKRYLAKYGSELASIHKINCSCFSPAKVRNINDIPNKNDYKTVDDYALKLINFLKKEKPIANNDTFIHGDFHYANILWKNGKINGVLDFEYSGKGFKEQDIAWAIVLRPGQDFMNCYEDITCFLDGYRKNNTYDKKSLIWCLVNSYCHFYLMNINNKDYINKIKKIINIIMNL